ncbi:hypothetical protein ISCGN_031528 [Ixodes scapularis]
MNKSLHAALAKVCTNGGDLLLHSMHDGDVANKMLPIFRRPEEMEVRRDSAPVPRLANSSVRLSARELRLARDIDRYFRDELIYKRNHRMGDRVLRLLREHPGQSFFFAFGAGHFLGNNTVLDFVRQGGFNIEHIVATRRIRILKKSWDRRSESWRDESVHSLDDQGGPSSPGEAQRDDSATSGQAPTHPGSSKRNPKRTNRPLGIAQTTPSSHTGRPRKFHDLWVKLDGFTTWRSLLQHRPTAPHDGLAVQQSLKSWQRSSATLGYAACPLQLVPWIVLWHRLSGIDLR